MLLKSEGSIRPEASDVVILTERNVIMNSGTRRRQGMQVRKVVTGHDAKVGLLLCETRESMGRPSLA